MNFHGSYISEAAASLLDRRLDLHIVPRTELVSLSSPVSFRPAVKSSRGREDLILKFVGVLLRLAGPERCQERETSS